MESKLRFNAAFYNKINSLNLRAAVITQADLVRNKKWTMLSPNFLNATFRADENDFNFHFHTTNNACDDCTCNKIRMSPGKQWVYVLEYVHRDDISILILSGTLVELSFKPEKTGSDFPKTLVGKLLVILLERYKAFAGFARAGMMIVLTGDLEGCAHWLEAHLLELAHLNKVEPAFLDWVEDANFFYNIYNGDILHFPRSEDLQLLPLLPKKQTK